jgi:hypothetical protein
MLRAASETIEVPDQHPTEKTDRGSEIFLSAHPVAMSR